MYTRIQSDLVAQLKFTGEKITEFKLPVL